MGKAMVPPELGLAFDVERCPGAALNRKGIDPKASCTLLGAPGSSVGCTLGLCRCLARGLPPSLLVGISAGREQSWCRLRWQKLRDLGKIELPQPGHSALFHRKLGLVGQGKSRAGRAGKITAR